MTILEAVKALGDGPIPLSQTMELIKEQAIATTTIYLALLDKGIITEGELNRYQAVATHMADQMMAAKSEELMEKLRADYPTEMKALERHTEQNG